MAANDPGQPALTGGGAEPTFDLAPPRVAMAVGAHPDDIEFGCGATLAKWAAAGCLIHYVVCTDGSKGTWDVDADIAALVRVRKDEQRAAARALLGVHAGEVRFLGAVDGELTSGLDTRWELVKVLRELRPDVVLGHDPWKRYRIHPDHRHAGFLVTDAVASARDPHFFSDMGLEAHRPEVLLLFEADEHNHVEDATGWVDAKLAGLEAHRSQFESTMHATGDDDLQPFRTKICTRLAELGAPHGLAAAEVFARIDEI